MAMIEPKQARSVVTRQRLLDAAVEILVEDGHLGLSAATVARRAGVSRGAFQHHFPDRQTLLIEALHHLSDLEQGVLRERLATVEPGENGIFDSLDIVFDAYCGTLFATMLELALASRREPELETAILEEERTIGLRTHDVADAIFGGRPDADPDFTRKWNYCRSVMRGVASLSFLGHSPKRVQRQWIYARGEIVDLLSQTDDEPRVTSD
jgi:AcrR family transcriptional regulator